MHPPAPRPALREREAARKQEERNTELREALEEVNLDKSGRLKVMLVDRLLNFGKVARGGGVAALRRAPSFLLLRRGVL